MDDLNVAGWNLLNLNKASPVSTTLYVFILPILLLITGKPETNSVISCLIAIVNV